MDLQTGTRHSTVTVLHNDASHVTTSLYSYDTAKIPPQKGYDTQLTIQEINEDVWPSSPPKGLPRIGPSESSSQLLECGGRILMGRTYGCIAISGVNPVSFPVTFWRFIPEKHQRSRSFSALTLSVITTSRDIIKTPVIQLRCDLDVMLVMCQLGGGSRTFLRLLDLQF